MRKILLAGMIGLLGLLGPVTAAGAAASKAILAGGCFWCVEHDFMKLPGVLDAVSGYSCGTSAEPTYKSYNVVGATNPVPHVEVVEITYDPARLSYDQLLDYYFRHIDPADGGGQFCDRGPAYRPVIFAASAAEREIAEDKKTAVAKLIGLPVAVEIADAAKFWPAEDYHQDYAEKHPVKYKYYRWNCGRDRQVEKVWSGAAG